jgi:hypothetical protein
MTTIDVHSDIFLADTGDFFRAYIAGDDMTRRNMALGLHLRLRDQNAALARARGLAYISSVLLAACVIGILAATH